MMHLTVVVALLAQTAPAPQEEYEDHLGLGLAGVKVTGGLATELWFDDNILLSREQEVDDFITVLVPELHVRLGREDDYFTLDYRGRDRLFAENSRFDGMEHYLDATLRAHWGIVTFDLWNEYQSRNDPFSLPGTTQRIDWLQNEAGGIVSADFGPVDAEASARIRRLEIFDAVFDLFDHRRWEASLLASYDAGSKVQAIGEYGVGHTEYDNEDAVDDFAFAWSAGGLRGQLSETLQVTLKAGWFRVSTDNTSGVVESRGDSGFFFAAAFAWQASDEGVLRLDLQRRPLESIYTGWLVAQRADATYSHLLWERATLSLGGYYETLEENLGGEDRAGYGLNAGLKIPVSRHFEIALWGERRSKSSDDHTFEYDNMRGFVSFAVTW